MITTKHITFFSLLAFLICMTVLPAQAQTVITTQNPVITPQFNQPQPNQLPMGTDWEAVINVIQPGLQPALILRLTQKVGSCVPSPPDNHHPGDTISINIPPAQMSHFLAGTKVHVWLAQYATLLNQPVCQYH